MHPTAKRVGAAAALIVALLAAGCRPDPAPPTEPADPGGGEVALPVDPPEGEGGEGAEPAPPAGPEEAPPAADAAAITIVAAGDIAHECGRDDSGCGHYKTAALVEKINPDRVITMGDNQYYDGTYAQFTGNFDKSWGRFKDKIWSVPGNHENHDGLRGYKRYFGDRVLTGDDAWYSEDIGDWHFVMLDSNRATDSAQLDWLRKDLAATKQKCIGASFHHPRYNSGGYGDHRSVRQIWDILLEFKADLAMGGHEHLYERFEPQDNSGHATSGGIVHITNGLGGSSKYDFDKDSSNVAKQIEGGSGTDRFGVVKLNLTGDSWQAEFVTVGAGTLDSSPTYRCH